MKKENLFQPPVRIFLLIAFVFSWPFLIYGFGWFSSEEDILARYMFSCTGMLMVGFSAFIVRVFVEHKGFEDIGLNLGYYKQYLGVLCFCLLLWAAPPLVGLLLGDIGWNYNLNRDALVVVILSLAGFSVVAGFGEEFGWRGYLLPRLLSDRRRTREILVIIGIIWGIWHFPIALGPMLRAILEGEFSISSLPHVFLSCAQMIFASIFLSLVFGALWLKSQSIFLVSFLHGYYDGIRDATTSLLLSYSGSSLIMQSNALIIRTVILLITWFIVYRWLEKYEHCEDVS